VAGRYRLDRLLGQGGMGEVWAATHTVTRRSVAMKFVKGTANARPELRRRFMREARAASAVQHPNVVEVFDVFEIDAETPVMVMELLSGETLGKRLSREGQLPLAEALAVLLPAVSAVGTAHALGVVHRDLKPDNLFLAQPAGSTSDVTVVKVLDFGIAKLSSELSGETGVTESGTTLGTPCYMAPEQAMAERDLDHRVDLWAFGVILYETLSGARPVEGDSVGQVVKHLMTTGIMPLERVVPGLPPSLTELVTRLLSRDRHRRPEDMREVFDVLQKLTGVRARSFGAPGSQAPSPTEIEALSASDDALLLHAEGSPVDAVGTTVRGGPLASTVRVEPIGPAARDDTAGPHAVSSRVKRRPLGNRRLASVAAIAIGSALLVYSLTRRAPIAPAPPVPSAPAPASGASRAPAATGDPTVTAIPSPDLTHAPTPLASAPAASAERSARSVKRGLPTKPRDAKAAGPAGSREPAASAPAAEAPAASAPTASAGIVVKTPGPGGLAEKPPF
jgi:eukaryotic-like serine/threonine-protein kinase